ncbi:MAG: bifunctional 4-hydroxy-3-methylbut-2-enyl diphosphate reductase/30S ribosomal protein S1 [Firmicutes bacterium]|nr:bifunctional 4-hydroxy-3-methylbut-2-enyl diphosphate reductase/30S ribosomal protein S1 [Bacillota bacterium]
MEIIVARSAGFCFGVKRALDFVYNSIGKDDIYTLGPIIHNKIVTDDLEKKGVKVIENPEDVKSGTVIIRSHGVGPDTYEIFEKNHIDYIDGTCPFVKKIHNIAEKVKNEGKHLIIAGDPNHPEVTGIKKWGSEDTIIIKNPEDLDNIDLNSDFTYVLVAQTTFSYEMFDEIINKFKDNFRDISIEFVNTICTATLKRQREAENIAENVDKMLIIGDKNSSNTQKLYNICKKKCNNVYFIENSEKFLLNNFGTNDKIGISAGASTPSAIIKEVIVRMSDLNVNDDVNVVEEGEKSFEEMLDDNFVILHTGDVVKGKVIRVSNEEVSVDLGYKSDGIIPRSEFSSDPNVIPSQTVQPGDVIEVFIVRVNDGEGNVLLSKKRIEAQKGMSEIEDAYNNKTVVTGNVTDIVKGGLIAVANGIRVFIPSSQVSNRYIEDLSVFKGQDLDFNIIEMDKVKRRIIGGRKELIAKELQAKKDALFESLTVGQKIDGKVSRITDFGAFVDLGGVDGLIHISEMSWGRIGSPREVLKEGDEVKAIVLDINKEKGKISLSLKDEDNNPWKLAVDKYVVGSTVQGKVVRMVPFGAFVELEPGVDGLVHISQIAAKHVVKPEDELTIGEIINVKVLDVNGEQKKISLSKKEADVPAQEKEEAMAAAEEAAEAAPAEETPTAEEAPAEEPAE